MTKRSRKNRTEKASDIVESLRVKLHVFRPSGREIWTVVGKEGDFLVDEDPEIGRNTYCSCGDFHFRVLSGLVPECYHLIALREGRKKKVFAKVEFSDEEYSPFLSMLVRDFFAQLS